MYFVCVYWTNELLYVVFLHIAVYIEMFTFKNIVYIWSRFMWIIPIKLIKHAEHRVREANSLYFLCNAIQIDSDGTYSLHDMISNNLITPSLKTSAQKWDVNASILHRAPSISKCNSSDSSRNTKHYQRKVLTKIQNDCGAKLGR